MDHLSVVLVSGAVGALTGASIFFVKEEPNKGEVFIATTLRNGLVGLLTAFSIQFNNSLLAGLAYGGLYGFISSLVVFLALGGLKSKHHLVIVISGTIVGIITGGIISKFVL
jgi:hypothetical protein